MSTPSNLAHQRIPAPAVRALRATRSGWFRLGEQARFFGQTLASLVDVVLYYRGELLRQVAAMSLGTGSLAVIGGTVAVTTFLTMSTGGALASEGYNQLSNIGVEALTGFASAFARPWPMPRSRETVLSTSMASRSNRRRSLT